MHPTANVSEEVNRKCRNTTAQLSSPYTDPECHNAQRHRPTDRRTDRQSTISCQSPIIPHSAKNWR